jgi:preprotein translocase subunit SecE
LTNILIAYLSVGVLIGFGALCIDHTFMTEYDKRVRDIIWPNRSLFDRFKEVMVVPLAITMIVLGWPYLIYAIFIDGINWRKIFRGINKKF